MFFTFIRNPFSIKEGMIRLYVLIVVLICALQTNAQLIINEVSQGANAEEYVELLVVGTPTCGSNTVDLRGWIIDDNNGWHASGAGQGIAAGHVRFANIAQWSAVKIGSIILVYNDAEVGAAVSALTDDISDANADCRYIIPISSSVFEKNTTQPSTSTSSYTSPVPTYSTTGTWTQLGMANGGDAFHTVSPANYTIPHHAIGWGSNSAQVDVYYSNAQGQRNVYMANTVDNNPFNQANYINGNTPADETPGAPNNTANAAWIAILNNNCQPIAASNVLDTVIVPICQGDTVNINNQIINTAGSYRDTIPTTGAGCDTIRTYNVTVSPLNTKNIPVTLCQGQSTVINGQTITTAGNYLDTIPSTTASCDTIVTYNVTVTSNINDAVAIQLCQGESTQINGQTVNTSGTYLDTLASTTGGCDTIRTYNVTVTPLSTRSESVNLCPGESILINGQTVTTAGTYTETRPATTGCDTVVTYSVQTGSSIPVAISSNLCPGNSITINGQQVSTAGIYTETVPSTTGGCDTLITYTVTVSNYLQRTETIASCAGQTVVLNGVTYTASATVRDTVSSPVTCDTIVTYNIVFYPIYNLPDSVSICAGDSYFAGGAQQTTAGIYVDNFTTVNGCDSVVTTTLTILQPTTENVSADVCIGELYAGATITVDTAYTVIYTNQTGCDSTVNYTITALQKPVSVVSDDVTIEAGQETTITASGGTSYIWSSGQNFEDITVKPAQTTLYYVTVFNSNGCSVVDSTLVTVVPAPEVDVKIPTAFSPNGDGPNDFFDVLNRFQVRVNEFRIYNRWGELVHNNPDDKWDGRYKNVEQPIGTYVYYLKVTYITSGKQDALSGNVTLLR